MPWIWKTRLKKVRERGDRITNETERREDEFEERVIRVTQASSRAEIAAVLLMQRHEDLLRAAARHR